jgi:hypothetical protein
VFYNESKTQYILALVVGKANKLQEQLQQCTLFVCGSMNTYHFGIQFALFLKLNKSKEITWVVVWGGVQVHKSWVN